MDEQRPPAVPDDPAGIDEPHDILAAEEFPMPVRSAGDPPPDPTGIREPHDVLAAEEFAMPAPDVSHTEPRGFEPRSLFPALALLAVVALILRRVRR